MTATAPITLLAFGVYGTPLAKGSLRFVGRNRPPINDNPALVDWQNLVVAAAVDAKQAAGLPILEGPVRVVAEFYFVRPAGHYSKGRSTAGRLLPSAPDHHTKRPDLDKLARAVLDALTKVVWRDDSQVIELAATKRYGDLERLEVAIETATAAGPSPAPRVSAVGGRAQPARDNPHPTPLHIITDNR